MSNMSYCRFENTLPDLQDCADALDAEGTAKLEDSEKRAANALIALCKRIANDYTRPQAGQRKVPGFIKPDTDTHVYFYEQDHYYLSNFSAFRVLWKGILFATSEQAYHWERFSYTWHKDAIIDAHSAHEAFRYAQDNKQYQRANWDEIKVGVMRDILRAKVRQHEYVRRKLLQTGDKKLIEDSHRDPYWGWGPNADGLNMLGKLWMEIRSELLSSQGGSHG